VSASVAARASAAAPTARESRAARSRSAGPGGGPDPSRGRSSTPCAYTVRPPSPTPSAPAAAASTGPALGLLLGARGFYKLLTAVVVPRPIAWVSTRSADGVGNLAPHSFFTVSCVNPPMVQFTSVGKKDSLRNALETGEFVVCLATEALFEQVNATGTNFPAGVDEFAAVGLTAEPSALVAPPATRRW
jgi:hypothetical protein